MINSITAILCLCFSFVLHRGELPQDKKNFSRLRILEGLWVRTGEEYELYEQWEKVNNNQLQGRVFRVRNGDTIISEQVTLSRKQHQIVYVASVANQNEQQPIPFFLISSKNKTFVFENPTHDFPKRVVYRIPSPDSIHAWIDGGTGETARRVDYHYKRVR